MPATANGKPGRETTVGILFFVALGLLGVFTILIGDIPVFKQTWSFDVLFDDVGGLEKGQDVLYAGGQVGKIREIQSEETKIRVILDIQKGLRVYRDGVITIEEKSALGGMRVAITRGTPAAGTLAPGDEVQGKGLNTLTTQIKDAAQKISRLADTANDALSSLKEGKGTLGKLWSEEAVYNDLKAAIADLKETSANFRSITRKVDGGEGILGQFVNDNESRDNLKDILASWKNVSKKLESGEGALGDLVMNPDTKKDFKETLVKFKEFGNSVTKLKTFLGTSYTSVPEDHYTVTKIYLRLEPREDRYYLIGGSFFRIQDSSPLTTPRTMLDDELIGKVDVQIAQRFLDNNAMTFRGGFIEGKPGLGLDYATTCYGNPFVATLEGRASWDDSRIHEAYDPFLLRAKVDMTFYKYFHLMVGVNSLTERPRGMYGIGFEFQDQDLKYLLGAMGTGR